MKSLSCRVYMSLVLTSLFVASTANLSTSKSQGPGGPSIQSDVEARPPPKKSQKTSDADIAADLSPGSARQSDALSVLLAKVDKAVSNATHVNTSIQPESKFPRYEVGLITYAHRPQQLFAMPAHTSRSLCLTFQSFGEDLCVTGGPPCSSEGPQQIEGF